MPKKNHVDEKPASRLAQNQAIDETSSADLEHWAALVADGEIGFPQDLPDDQIMALEQLVRSRLRKRLTTYIALQIAQDLARDSRPKGTPS